MQISFQTSFKTFRIHKRYNPLEIFIRLPKLHTSALSSVKKCGIKTGLANHMNSNA